MKEEGKCQAEVNLCILCKLNYTTRTLGRYEFWVSLCSRLREIFYKGQVGLLAHLLQAKPREEGPRYLDRYNLACPTAYQHCLLTTVY